MYLKLSSGRLAVIGVWPSSEELQEVDELLSHERGANEKVIVILDVDAPITKEDLIETKNEIINHIRLLATPSKGKVLTKTKS